MTMTSRVCLCLPARLYFRCTPHKRKSEVTHPHDGWTLCIQLLCTSPSFCYPDSTIHCLQPQRVSNGSISWTYMVGGRDVLVRTTLIRCASRQQLTNSMVESLETQSPTWYRNSRFSWNQKVHRHVYKTHHWTLSWASWIYSTPSHLSKIHFYMIFQSMPSCLVSYMIKIYQNCVCTAHLQEPILPYREGKESLK
jgi:hypothetical protein